jgi:hypothetical protein
MLDTSTGFSDGYNVSRCIPITQTGSAGIVFTVFPRGETKVVIFARSNASAGTLGAAFEKLDGITSDAAKLDSGSFTCSAGQVIRHVIEIGRWRPTPISDFTDTCGFLYVTGSGIASTAVTVLAVRNLGEFGASGSLSGIVNTV